MAKYSDLKAEFSAASMSLYVPGNGGKTLETKGFGIMPDAKSDLGANLGVDLKPPQV